MDNTKATTHLGLCAGYGGIELGLHRVIRNLRTVALCEIEGFACANLVSKMEAGLLDAAPIWTDLKTFPWAEFRDRVDILTGGYPCQPFSAAGKRLGTEDPRHLWPFIADGIRILRPKLCFFENVEGHISLGLREVIGELESIGYQTAWGIFSASEVGAPHQRKRVFILAYRISKGPQGCLRSFNMGLQGEAQSLRPAWQGGLSAWPSRPGEQQFAWEPPRVVGDAKDKRKLNEAEQNISKAGALPYRASEGAGEGMGNATMLNGTGQAGGFWAAPPWRADTARHISEAQPPLGRDSDGTTNRLDDAELYTTCDNRTDELRLLGNGVVPATAERAFNTLWEELSK